MTNARLTVAAISLLGGLAVMAAPGQAQQTGALQACGAIKSKSARLDCYDQLARGASAGAPAEAAQEQAAPPAASFGRDSIKPKHIRAKPEAESRITAEVVSAADNGIGHWLITLSDGAQWRMTEGVSTFIPPRKGDMVTIRRSALGGYLMDVDHQVSVRVRRLN